MRWRFHNGEVIPAHLIPQERPQRSNLPAPMVIRDEMDFTMNPANGQRYTSKRAYEKAVKQAGCVIVGNEAMPQQPSTFDPGPMEHDVKRAMEELGA